ncbi:MAG: hypothetical protein ABIO38_03210 [Luteimonas sp.]
MSPAAGTIPQALPLWLAVIAPGGALLGTQSGWRWRPVNQLRHALAAPLLVALAKLLFT